jgi:hypothetical protein
MPALNRTWTGEEWQTYVDQLLHRRYSPGNYQKVPDRFGGDHGIEGFSIDDGCAYQCYAVEGQTTAGETYEKQRDKLTGDIAKFVNNRDGLASLFGDIKVRRWILVVPEFDNRQLVAHASTKTQTVKSAALPYVSDDFRIVVVNDDAFALEREALRTAGLVEIVVDPLPPAPSAISSWIEAEGNSELLSNLRAKVTALVPSGKHDAVIRELLHSYLMGQEILNHLHNYFPQTYEAVLGAQAIREEVLKLQSALGEAGSALNPHIEQFEEALQSDVGGISRGDTSRLARGAVADWLMRCPLELSVG